MVALLGLSNFAASGGQRRGRPYPAAGGTVFGAFETAMPAIAAGIR